MTRVDPPDPGPVIRTRIKLNGGLLSPLIQPVPNWLWFCYRAQVPCSVGLSTFRVPGPSYPGPGPVSGSWTRVLDPNPTQVVPVQVPGYGPGRPGSGYRAQVPCSVGLSTSGVPGSRVRVQDPCPDVRIQVSPPLGPGPRVRVPSFPANSARSLACGFATGPRFRVP